MRPLNQYSKAELQRMFEQGVIGRCSVCKRYEPIERTWPYHNVIMCKACKQIKERKEYERNKETKYL